MVMNSQVIGSLIASLSALQAINVRLRRITALQQIYVTAVPPELAARSRISDERFGTLIVLSDTSAVAAKLRQLVPTIVAVFVKSVPEVTSIRIEVQVTAERRQTDTRAEIPPRALTQFEELRDSIPESPLRNALARLIEHSERRMKAD
jgi:hypothetical protein